MSKYPFSTWIYNPLSDFTPDVLEVWAHAGMNVPMTPKMYYGKDDPTSLIPWLDKAEALGMQLIINYEDVSYGDYIRIGAEEYERRLSEIYNVLKGHPALYGFYVGDEPDSAEELEATVQCYKINRKVAPELNAYTNLIGTMPRKGPEFFGGRTLTEWFKYFKEETGVQILSQDLYNPLINDISVGWHFEEVKTMVEAAEAAGVELWANMLCSGHDAFRAPSELDIRWQINVNAAVGCRGGIWFRMYDRALGNEYHGSPIDEYGNKTEAYYGMCRSQRRFTDHYGELLMSLKRQSTYMTGKDRGVYPMLTDDAHDLVKIDGYEEGVVSFYTAEDGKEYICMVNASMQFLATWKFEFDSEKCSVNEVLFNGTVTRPMENLGQVLYAGQMRMYRIDRK